MCPHFYFSISPYWVINSLNAALRCWCPVQPRRYCVTHRGKAHLGARFICWTSIENIPLGALDIVHGCCAWEVSHKPALLAKQDSSHNRALPAGLPGSFPPQKDQLQRVFSEEAYMRRMQLSGPGGSGTRANSTTGSYPRTLRMTLAFGGTVNACHLRAGIRATGALCLQLQAPQGEVVARQSWRPLSLDSLHVDISRSAHMSQILLLLSTEKGLGKCCLTRGVYTWRRSFCTRWERFACTYE